MSSRDKSVSMQRVDKAWESLAFTTLVRNPGIRGPSIDLGLATCDGRTEKLDRGVHSNVCLVHKAVPTPLLVTGRLARNHHVLHPPLTPGHLPSHEEVRPPQSFKSTRTDQMLCRQEPAPVLVIGSVSYTRRTVVAWTLNCNAARTA